VHVAWEGEKEQTVGWEEWEGEGRLRVVGMNVAASLCLQAEEQRGIAVKNTSVTLHHGYVNVTGSRLN